MERADCRAAGAGLAPTRKASVAVPWPLVDDASVIQDAAVEADHVQSGVVSIATVPEPPAAGTLDSELVADSWHFEVVGAVICVEDEWQPAITRQAMTTTVTGKVRSSRLMFAGATVQEPCRRIVIAPLSSLQIRRRVDPPVLSTRQCHARTIGSVSSNSR